MQEAEQINNVFCVGPNNHTTTAYAYIVTTELNNPFKVAKHQLKDILTVPTNFEHAFHQNNSWCRKKRREAIQLELQKMKTLKVWEPINYNQLPTGQKPIKHKWVFDIKGQVFSRQG
jgi:hypothetical protein